MAKRDLKKELKEFYGPGARDVVTVNVPPMNFLMIDGKGDPNTAQEYREAVEDGDPAALRGLNVVSDPLRCRSLPVVHRSPFSIHYSPFTDRPIAIILRPRLRRQANSEGE